MLSIILIQNQNTSLNNDVITKAIQAIQPFAFLKFSHTLISIFYYPFMM